MIFTFIVPELGALYFMQCQRKIMMESGDTLLNNHWLGNRGGSLAFLVGTIINVLVLDRYLSELCSQ
jgi:hypothetical protein